MKKVFLLTVAAIAFCGCQKDDFVESPEVTTGPAFLNLQISVDKLSMTRAVEEGHTVAGAIPKIYSVTVYAYNAYGVATELDLSPEQITEAVAGDYYYKNGKDPIPGGASIDAGGTLTDGAKVGLPVGTSKVDVVLNNPSSKYKDISQNINYYNHQNGYLTDGKWPNAEDGSNYFGDNNYDRVFFVTDKYGKGGYELVNQTAVGEYTQTFTVQPALARFEVYGSINAKAEEKWEDAYGRYWMRIAKDALIAYAQNNFTGAAQKLIDGTSGGYKEGMLAETIDNVDYINIPEAYLTGGSKDNAKYNHGTNPVGTWAKNVYYESLISSSAQASGWQPINWFPNAFYAIDVEEIYLNNIHVASADLAVSPVLTPWPGFDNLGEAAGWPHWYKAYHLHGWHTAGYSAANSFYCMGNMWDRIAEADSKDVQKSGPLGTFAARGTAEPVKWNGLNVPSVSGGGTLETTYLKGGSQPIAKIAGYGDEPNKRNIGIIANKAAAYMFYEQSSKTSAGLPADAYTDLPHVIVKVKCYKDKASYLAGEPTTSKNFITMKLFSHSDNSANYITEFKKGTIYRVNLEDLLQSFVGQIPISTLPQEDSNKEPQPKDPVTPDPEMPGSQLIMGIKVLSWTIQNAKPVI